MGFTGTADAIMSKVRQSMITGPVQISNQDSDAPPLQQKPIGIIKPLAVTGQPINGVKAPVDKSQMNQKSQQ